MHGEQVSTGGGLALAPIVSYFSTPDEVMRPFYFNFLCLPDPESTFFCNPGRENDIKIKLEDLVKRAPSPLSFTLIGTSGVIVVKALDFFDSGMTSKL